MNTAMTNMIAFSINVASVMGSLSAVPKQAQRIAFLSIKVRVTPKVVIPRTTKVVTSATGIAKRNRNNRPKPNSKKG